MINITRGITSISCLVNRMTLGSALICITCIVTIVTRVASLHRDTSQFARQAIIDCSLTKVKGYSNKLYRLYVNRSDTMRPECAASNLQTRVSQWRSTIRSSMYKQNNHSYIAEFTFIMFDSNVFCTARVQRLVTLAGNGRDCSPL